MEELTKDQKIEELTNSLNNLSFLSDQVNFNKTVYLTLNSIVEKLTEINNKLNLPPLPDAQI